VHQHRPVKILRNDGFVAAPEVAAPLNLTAFLLEQRNRVVIAQPGKRQLDLLQVGKVALEDLQLRAPLREHALDDERNEFFAQHQDVVEPGKSDLRLHHPEFRQMPPGFRFSARKVGPKQ